MMYELLQIFENLILTLSFVVCTCAILERDLGNWCCFEAMLLGMELHLFGSAMMYHQRRDIEDCSVA